MDKHKFVVRGETVLKDPNSKTIFFNIDKTLGNRFSISDKLYDNLSNGYIIRVQLPSLKIVTIYKNSHVKRVETVKSKFANSPAWYRYWYDVSELERNEEKKGVTYLC